MRIVIAATWVLAVSLVGCSSSDNDTTESPTNDATRDAIGGDIPEHDESTQDVVATDSTGQDLSVDLVEADEAEIRDTADTRVVDYRFVMIRDTSTGGVGPVDGVDLFGLRVSAGDELYNAAEIHYCHHGSAGNPDGTDCDVILGEPFGRCQDPETVDWVSLAGPGGIVIASFDSEAVIHPGDRVQTFVCGAGEGDRYDLLIGPEPDASSDQWWLICEGLSGSVSCTVPE